MKFIDPHLHVDALNHHSLELMALTGVEAVISMVAVPEAEKDYKAQVIFDHCDRVRSYHAWRTQYYFGITTYACLGISMVGVPLDYEVGLSRMREYMKEHDKEILGIGEIGIEPSSMTCPDLKIQERVFRAQLDMAREFSKPVVLHTPPVDKADWIAKYVPMLREHGVRFGQVIFDHCQPPVVKMIADLGAMAALTVQPWRKVRPVDAAEAVKAGDPQHIMVDSDCSLLESDPLAVPKVAFEMRRMGLSEEVIRTVVWDNPPRLYHLASEGQ